MGRMGRMGPAPEVGQSSLQSVAFPIWRWEALQVVAECVAQSFPKAMRVQARSGKAQAGQGVARAHTSL